MAKTTKKKRGAADESSPFVLVRSKTGRSFQRCGIRFEPDRDEPVNLDKLTAEQRAQLCSSQHLSVTHVSSADYDQALSEQRAVEVEELEDVDVPTLIAERNALRDEVAALRSEVALLTGRRPREGGPRENDDKPASKPLMG